jgi:hypothetical protein
VHTGMRRCRDLDPGRHATPAQAGRRSVLEPQSHEPHRVGEREAQLRGPPGTLATLAATSSA